MSETAWPEPIVGCTAIALDDERLPKAARDMHARAERGGCWAHLMYAFGTSMQGKECVPGPLVETVALRGKTAAGRRFVAIWAAFGSTVCVPCGKALKPTVKGVFRKHPSAGKGTAECPGSGAEATRADAVPGVTPWAFQSAYVSEPDGWWSTGAPVRISSTELSALLSG